MPQINYYALMACVHLIGILGFQYTESFYFLIPGVGLILYSMWSFMKAVATILSPGDVEIEFDDDPFIYKVSLQVGVLLTAYITYTLGYEFFAGAATLLASTTILAAVYTWAYFYDEENE